MPKPSDERPDERDLYYTAAGCLNDAFRELGDAADCLRDLPGMYKFLAAVGRAKAAVEAAKREIGA